MSKLSNTITFLKKVAAKKDLTAENKQNLPFYAMRFGCDPEFFFSMNGKIIGSEKVIPDGGFLVATQSAWNGVKYVPTTMGPSNKIVRDGVQAELNPPSEYCRALLGEQIVSCFKIIEDGIKGKGVSLDFSQTVLVDEEELMSLDAKSRVFGCAPSKNAYGEEKMVSKKDPSSYLYRSAGGHIHMSFNIEGWDHFYNPVQAKEAEIVKKILKEEPERIIRMMDIIVGNTCVLIDRDPGNVERRQVYGRAGEYRTPRHGLEYRTLSNFWLRSYPLMSLAVGLTRFACALIAHPEYEELILSRTDIEDVRKAINENDFDLAYKNFRKIEDVFTHITPTKEDGTINYPLQANNMSAFHYFVKTGINYWFKEDPMKHWISSNFDGHRQGWESFLRNEVMREMNSKTVKAV